MSLINVGEIFPLTRTAIKHILVAQILAIMLIQLQTEMSALKERNFVKLKK